MSTLDYGCGGPPSMCCILVVALTGGVILLALDNVVPNSYDCAYLAVFTGYGLCIKEGFC